MLSVKFRMKKGLLRVREPSQSFEEKLSNK